MKLLIVSDSYLPKKNSAAIQIHDLCIEFHRQGHEVTLVTTMEQGEASERFVEGIRIISVFWRSRDDDSFLRKFISQLFLPYKMYLATKKHCDLKGIGGIVWYSPSIFLWPFIFFLRVSRKVKSYLILRDIFPEWAFETGVIKSKVIFLVLRWYASFQYKIADSIGIQALGNITYLPVRFHRKVHVLENWLNDLKVSSPTYTFEDKTLSDKKVLLYAGNVGVAQGFNRVIELAVQLNYREDIVIACFSRGSDLKLAKRSIKERNLENVRFFDVVEHELLHSICKQCVLGIVALDPKHLTHNIPGKFLMYMRSGLPVVALVNHNNELIDIIDDNQVGIVLHENEKFDWHNKILRHIDEEQVGRSMEYNCRELFRCRYTVENAVNRIISELKC